MKLHDIRRVTPRRKKRRVGRGQAARGGKTAGRGTKGQKSRAGFDIPRRFEGGQTPLVQRLPKAGGFYPLSTRFPVVKVEEVNKAFKQGERVSPKTLLEKGLVRSASSKVKLVGPSRLARFLRLQDILLTRRLREALPKPPKLPTSRPSKKKVARSK